MNYTGVEVAVTEPDGAKGMTKVATIWARAKTRRDEKPTNVEETMLGIRRPVSVDGARLLFAHRNDPGVGVALFAPRARTMELFYLSQLTAAAVIRAARHQDHAREHVRKILEL